jgi:hypothetical protein
VSSGDLSTPPFGHSSQATVYTQVGWTSFLDLNPPNPLKKGAKIRILVPLLKGDLGGFLGFSLYPDLCIHGSLPRGDFLAV